MEAVREGGVLHLPLRDLSWALRAQRQWAPDARSCSFLLEGHHLRMTAGSRVVIVDEAEALLAESPILYRAGDLYVPLGFALGPIDSLVAARLSWDGSRGALEIRSGGANVAGIFVRVLPGETRLEVALTTPSAWEAAAPGHNRVTLRIPDATLDPDSTEMPAGAGLVTRVRSTAVPGALALSVEYRGTVGALRLDSETGGKRLSASFRGEPGDEAGWLRLRLPKGETRPPRRIAIDPGHGGSDPGVTGSGGIAEKDAMLELARSLAGALTARGFTPGLVRTADQEMRAEDRIATATREGADVFVSLHLDASGANEAVAFVPPPPAAGAAGAFLRREGRGFLGLFGRREITAEILPWGGSSFVLASESGELGRAILERIADQTGLANGGVRGAPIGPLRGASVPAVLLECGSATRGGEALFRSAEAVDRLAGAIAAGIARYSEGRE
jgi:N-acetylmuramoyl-L-alanine amidase